jgi:hypothetical protein
MPSAAPVLCLGLFILLPVVVLLTMSRLEMSLISQQAAFEQHVGARDPDPPRLESHSPTAVFLVPQLTAAPAPPAVAKPASFGAAYSRLKARGLPFAETWHPSPYTNSSVLANWEEGVSRAISGDPSRWPVYVSWTPHGFGSNMLSQVNFVVYAALHNASLLLVSKGSALAPPLPRPVGENLNTSLLRWWGRHQTKQATLQAWYEESFEYSALGETATDRYKELCWGKPDCDFTPFGPRWAVGTGDYFKMTRYFLRSWRHVCAGAFGCGERG